MLPMMKKLLDNKESLIIMNSITYIMFIYRHRFSKRVANNFSYQAKMFSMRYFRESCRKNWIYYVIRVLNTNCNANNL